MGAGSVQPRQHIEEKPPIRANGMGKMTFTLKIIAAIGIAALAGCATDQPTDIVLNAPTRPLTAAERASIGHQIALTLNDPGSAQFQWPNVIETHRGSITDYCGFVNAKNAMGGYSGFQEYYGQLSADASGALSKIDVRLMGQPGDDVSTGATADDCRKAGYGAITLH